MFGTPSFDSPLTYFGVLLVTLGVYLALSGFGILKIEKYTTPEGVKSWGSGLLLGILGLAVLFILPGLMSGGNQQEVGILECQNNPNRGIVKANIPIVLIWGWATDDNVKRDELLSISSFVVVLDGKSLDVNAADRTLKSSSASWRLSIGRLVPGIHKIELVRIISRDFTDSDGTYPAGRQETSTCELVVEK